MSAPGAGFPGMPLLIANPQLSVNFIDSSGKRINFIKDVLSNIGIIATSTHERAEDVGKNPEFREQYDFATARAVAPLNVLCEYCLPLVKVGGRFVSLKGSNGLEELEAAKMQLRYLAERLRRLKATFCPTATAERYLLLKRYRKLRQNTPENPKKLIPDRSKYNGICRIIRISHDEKSFIFVILYGIFISRSERRGANRSNTYGKAVA